MRMENMKRFRLISLILSVMMLAGVLNGCGKEDTETGEPVTEETGDEDTKDYPEPEMVTYIVGSGDPAVYHVFLITPESVTYCDLTSQWMDGYNYFRDPFPDDGEYTSEEYPIVEEDWDRILESLNENDYYDLPEDLSTEGVMDGGFSFIGVKTADEEYKSGGSNVSAGSGSKRKKYTAISEAIWTVIHAAYGRAPVTITTPQPEPVLGPATREYFVNLDREYTLSDIMSEVGNFERENTDCITRYGWKLDDGGFAWVLFGGKEGSVYSIQIEEDDCFTVVYDHWDALNDSSDNVYYYLHEDGITAEEIEFFETISLMICDQYTNNPQDCIDNHQDYIAVNGLGEILQPYDLSEEDRELFIHARMHTDDLEDLYSEVFDMEKEFEPSDDIPEIGVICRDDGYCYAKNGCGWYEYTEIVSAASNDDLFLYDVSYRTTMSGDGDQIGALRLLLRPTEGKYGYTIVDYEYYAMN